MIAVAAAMIVLVAAIGNVMLCQSQARSVADAAALAAATALYQGKDNPCGEASEIVGIQRAILAECRVDNEDVIVNVHVTTRVAAVGEVSRAARAGPQVCG